MSSNTKAAAISKKRLWTSRILSGISVLFLLFDGISKLMRVPQVIEASAKLGYPVYLIQIIGLILLICTILYVIPRTSILGAILLTGYLGGAVASNLRIESPLFSNTLFPIYMGVLVWGGIFLCEKQLSLFIPFRKTEDT